MINEEEIGLRIKSLRKKRSITLDVLSESTGFTKGYLSKVENSKKAPPVSTLIKIVTVFGVSISEIFGEADKEDFFSITKGNSRPSAAREASAYGYTYESLASGYYYRHFDPFIITIPPNREQPFFQHNGEEMIFQLEGKIKVTYNSEEFLLEEGDCMYFNSSKPHHAYALGKKPAKSLMVIYTPKMEMNNL